MLIRINGLPAISAPFGSIDVAHKTPHTGVDIPLPEGTPIHSIAAGIVDHVTNYADSIGRGVVVRMSDGSTTIYGHLSKLSVKPGEHVMAGEILGFSGNTGNSTGPHLHLGMMDPSGHYVDPTKYLSAAVYEKGHSWIDRLNPFNGVKESIDTLTAKIDTFFYWINPAHWGEIVAKGWHGLEQFFQSGALDTPLMVGTIGGIVLMMLGARWPKKWLFWGWIVFWTLRGCIFA